MNYTLIIGPSHYTRGGITSVIETYKSNPFWKKWNCIWIPTYVDKSSILKILFFIFGYIKFIIYLPFSKIVHIHIALGTSAFRKKFFFYLASFFRKKIIFHFHTPGTALEPPRDFPIVVRIFIKASAVIVLSEGWKELVLKYCPTAKVYTIPNPAPPIKEIKKDREKWILFAGTLDDRKGFRDLINAFAIIHKKHPDWKLIFAGNGLIDEGKKMAKSLNIHSSIVFKGWIKGEEKDLLFSNSSIFCLPSYAEGFPVSILEALSYGLPIVCSPVGGIKDYLSENTNFISCQPGNINDISSKLNLLIENQVLHSKMTMNSQKIAIEIFSIQKITDKMGKIYTNINTQHKIKL